MQLLEFGDFLHTLRIGKGVTIREVSYACGVDRDLLAQLEIGKRRTFPKHGTMTQIAKFFGFKFLYIEEQMLIVKCPTPDMEPEIEPKDLLTMNDYEKHAIETALKRNNRNRDAAAKQLGFSIRKMYRKIEKYDIQIGKRKSRRKMV